MGMEIEVKAYADDLEEIEGKIRDMGAELTWEGGQKDTYYNHPERDFARTDEALRIRREQNRNTIAYKGPKIDEQSKTREEIQFRVEDPQEADKMLVKLGFVPVGTVTKYRRKFRLEDMKISLDMVENLGDFVEIEALEADLSEDDVSETRDRILAVMEELGLTRRERTSYLELLHPELK